MIRDRKAEELESKGLYRRAAARWAEVMMLADGDKEREHAANRRSECIRKAARPPATTDRFGDLRQAVKRTHSALGMDEEARGYFRRYRDKDCQNERSTSLFSYQLHMAVSCENGGFFGHHYWLQQFHEQYARAGQQA